MKRHNNKIKIKEVSEDISKYSSKASELTHQLMIAGIVIIWIVSSSIEDANDNKIHNELIIALITFIIGLVFSVAHYAISAIISDRFYHKVKRKNEKLSDKDFREYEVEEPSWHEQFTWICFYVKHSLMVIGYVFIIYFMFAKYW